MSSGPVDGIPGETRAARKQRTRRAILDAALALTEGSSLVALSLRQVAGQVGIVPTAFYRHFGSIDELGLALVEESMVSLRTLLRDAREAAPATGEPPTPFDLIDVSVHTLLRHVRVNHRHFRFIARERVAGTPAVREAVRHQLELVERELATDIARLPGTRAWSGEDLQMLAGLLVTAMVGHAEELARAGGRAAAEDRVADLARRQLQLVVVGALRWRSGVSHQARDAP